MAQTEGRTPETRVPSGQRISATQSKSSRSSIFKYYIHDAVESCRLELIGELSDAEVPELNGCWTTAKTTLGSRKLLLDLRKLSAIDDSGRQWIISMAADGASLLPDTFLRNGLAGQTGFQAEASKAGLFSRCLTVLRGSRTLPAQSSTQAQ